MIAIQPHQRSFDGRTVFLWELRDSRERLLDHGCELTRERVIKVATDSWHRQGPEALLDMLECRG